MYVCMNVRAYACMCECRTYVCMHICMHACTHACMYVHTHACMHACMHARMLRVRVRARMCVYVCMYACMYVRIAVWRLAWWSGMHVCMHVCMCAFMNECSCMGMVIQVLASFAAEAVQTRLHPLPPPCAIIAGGETTVTLIGHGTGGRNQVSRTLCD